MSRPSSLIGTAVRLIGPPAVLLAGVGGFFVLASHHEQPKPREVETPTPLVETVPVSEAAGGLDLDAD
ncbi:MAG TPA: hypothetical protein VF170_08370, partial [Planctomycetaceae bacterium]